MISHVHIQTVARQGITRLKKAFCTPPFKVADITEDKKAGTLQLMLMSSSPGILDEDAYHLTIDVTEQCHLHLHTQSYQRLFNMKKGASQHVDIRVDSGASFIYLPHPSVPHLHSTFTSRNSIYLHPDSKLVWGEVLTCGRTLNGEQFLFSKYHTITEIFRASKLIIKENLLVQPAHMKIHALGQWEGFTHQASLIAVNHCNVELVNDYLLQQKNILFGISTTATPGYIVRILGFSAEQLFNCLKNINLQITCYAS